MGSLCLPNGAPLRQPGQYCHLKKNFFCIIRITGIPYCLPTKSKTQALSILLGKTSAHFIRNKMFIHLKYLGIICNVSWLTVFFTLFATSLLCSRFAIMKKFQLRPINRNLLETGFIFNFALCQKIF